MSSADAKRRVKLPNQTVYSLMEIQAAAERSQLKAVAEMAEQVCHAQDVWLTGAIFWADNKFDEVMRAYLARIDRDLDDLREKLCDLDERLSAIAQVAKLAQKGGSLTDAEAVKEAELLALMRE